MVPLPSFSSSSKLRELWFIFVMVNDYLTPLHYSSYLALFRGRQECGISSLSVYNPPSANDHEQELRGAYCQNRTSLLEALNNGGRQAFDAPYTPQG